MVTWACIQIVRALPSLLGDPDLLTGFSGSSICAAICRARVLAAGIAGQRRDGHERHARIRDPQINISIA